MGGCRSKQRWIPAEGRLCLAWEGRTEWPAAEIAAAGAELAKLTNLEGLWLNGNQLTALPPEIGRLAALKELYVHSNPVVDSWPKPVRRAVNENTGMLNKKNGAAQCAAVVAYLRSLPAPAPAATPAPAALSDSAASPAAPPASAPAPPPPRPLRQPRRPPLEARPPPYPPRPPPAPARRSGAFRAAAPAPVPSSAQRSPAATAPPAPPETSASPAASLATVAVAPAAAAASPPAALTAAAPAAPAPAPAVPASPAATVAASPAAAAPPPQQPRPSAAAPAPAASAPLRPQSWGSFPGDRKFDLSEERRTEWPAAEIAAAGPENVLELNLDGNNLSRIPGAELAKLTNLEKLFLNRNQLTALPPEIGLLSSLRELLVFTNKLMSLPPEIGRLTALKRLNVADNRLTSLPVEIGSIPAMKELNVNGNPLKDMPELRGKDDEAALAYLRSLAPAPAPAAPPTPHPAAAAAVGARDPRGMRMADVCEWLRSVELGDLAPAFERHRVDGKMLLELTEGDLQRELGVESGLIADLAREHGLASAAPSAPRARPQSAAAGRVPPLPPGYEFHAFITYRRLDGKNLLASLVREALDKLGCGHRCPPRALLPLTRRKLQVFVLTPGTLDRCFEDKAPSAALSNDWVRKEIAEGCRLRKAIIPFVDDPAQHFPACDGLPADMAAFSRHNAVFFNNMYQQAVIARLCALIDAAVADAAPFEELPAPLA
eukprot:tig00000600_g2283.t1